MKRLEIRSREGLAVVKTMPIDLEKRIGLTYRKFMVIILFIKYTGVQP